MRFAGDGPLRGVFSVSNGALESRAYVGNPRVDLSPQGVAAGVGRGDIRTRWPQIKTDTFAIQIVTYVKGGSASAHRIDHHITASGVALQQLPNHPAGSCALILLVALLIPSSVVPRLFSQIMLGGILPKGGGLDALRRLAATKWNAFVIHLFSTSASFSATVRNANDVPASVRIPSSTML